MVTPMTWGCRLGMTGFLILTAVSASGWQIVKEAGDQNSRIKTIQIVDDRLIIVTGTGVLDLKLDQLEQLQTGNKPLPPPPAAVPAPTTSDKPPAPTAPTAIAVTPKPAEPSLPDNAPLADRVVAALNGSGSRWFAFKGRPYGFKVMGQQSVKSFEEGAIFKGAAVDNRLYLKDENGVIYEPTWQISFDFAKFVMPVDVYVSKTLSAIDRLKINIIEKEKLLQDNRNIILIYLQQVVELLKNRKYTVAQLQDGHGNPNFTVIGNDDIDPNSLLLYTELRTRISRLENANRSLTKEIGNLKKNLQTAVDQYNLFREKLIQLQLQARPTAGNRTEAGK